MMRTRNSGPSTTVNLRLKNAEVEALDTLRGSVGRQDYIRRLIAAAAKAAKK